MENEKIKKEFMYEFQNYQVKDIKDKLNFKEDNDKDLEDFFDAVNCEIMNENISEKFLNNVYDVHGNDEKSIEQIILLIKYKYGPIINGRALYEIMEIFLNDSKETDEIMNLQDLKEYCEMIYFYFGRYQMNLDDEQDKIKFIDLLTNPQIFIDKKFEERKKIESTKDLLSKQNKQLSINTNINQLYTEHLEENKYPLLNTEYENLQSSQHQSSIKQTYSRNSNQSNKQRGIQQTLYLKTSSQKQIQFFEVENYRCESSMSSNQINNICNTTNK